MLKPSTNKETAYLIHITNMDQILTNSQLVALALVTILNFALGLYVFLKNPKNAVNRIFLLLIMSLVGWCMATFFSIYFANNLSLYDLSDKFAYIFGMSIALSFYLFSVTYPYKSRDFSSKLILGYLLLFCILIYVTFFTNLFVDNVFEKNGIIELHHNFYTYILYSIVIVLPFILAMSELWKKMLRGDGVYRQYFLTLIILVGCSIAAGFFFDLFLSAFNNYSYAALGPLSSILLSLAIMRMIISKK